MEEPLSLASPTDISRSPSPCSEHAQALATAGSSGPTTRWGAENFANLINLLNESGDYFFFILCGPNEKDVEEKILLNLVHLF